MTTEEEQSQEERDQQQRQRIRAALNNAYAFVLGQQSVRSFAAFTFNDALDLQTERLEGAGTDIRPNEQDRITRIYTKVLAAIEDVEDFPTPDVPASEAVNTPKEA